MITRGSCRGTTLLKLHIQMKKRAYTKPEVKKVAIDNEISMVMMSAFGPIGDPEASVVKKLNPLRWWK